MSHLLLHEFRNSCNSRNSVVDWRTGWGPVRCRIGHLFAACLIPKSACSICTLAHTLASTSEVENSISTLLKRNIMKHQLLWIAETRSASSARVSRTSFWNRAEIRKIIPANFDFSIAKRLMLPSANILFSIQFSSMWEVENQWDINQGSWSDVLWISRSN